MVGASLWIPVALVAAAAACRPSLNPVLQVPVPPVRLTLKGRVVSDSGTPIHAIVALVRLVRNGPADTVANLPVADGRFRFEGLAPGAYALDTRSIGYRRRRDTLALSASPGLEVVLELRRDPACLGYCPPDSEVVAAARAQQPRWQCDREKASIDMVRARWAEFLADSSMQAYFHHDAAASRIGKEMRRVRDDAVCRRLAVALFPEATSLAFTLFRWGLYWLLSDPYFGDGVVANDSLRPLAASYGGGFAVWTADPRIP